MPVLALDGEFLGTIRDVTPDGFVIRRAYGEGPAALIPERWISDVNAEHVYLNRTGAEAAAGRQALQFRKNERPIPGPPGDRPRRPLSSWMIFLGLLALMALAIMALVL